MVRIGTPSQPDEYFSTDNSEDILKIHQAEYKRRQAPIGIRVSQKAFSKGRNVPIVQKWQYLRTT